MRICKVQNTQDGVSSSCIPPVCFINLYEWLKGAFPLHGRTGWITSLLHLSLFAFVADTTSYFMRGKYVNSPKQLDAGRLNDSPLSWHCLGWLAGRADKELVVHRALHHTYHARNVLSALHRGSPQYHIRASATGLKYQRQQDTSLLYGGRNSRSQPECGCVYTSNEALHMYTYADTHSGCQRSRHAMVSG